MRNVKKIVTAHGMSSAGWMRVRSLPRVLFNHAVMIVANRMPSGPNKLFYALLGVKFGENVQLMPNPGFDLFFPDLIEVGDYSVIGLDCLIICHEFTTNVFQYGPVKIGRNVLIGTRSIILPGITIGDNSIVPAGTVIYKDVPKNTLAYGSPLKFKPLGVKAKSS